ncbi:hypothetical protein [Frigoriglobus tundricola]|uniref:Uncharacterized protein n=1 Tax=Frigoriglobus tundricola TaxID=2774151 RepID=A0A6M5Z4T6_9BACT|nr:hypothetical protein [Frigoriglobus tundricola]QJX00735.1 hypothetical protein FTUN_8367 [Frigoriglobus tundricola]
MDTQLGWTFTGIAALFSLGLVPGLAARFYPTRPGFFTRFAVPVIFAVMATASFAGFSTPVLVTVAVLGTAVIITRKKTTAVKAGATESVQ